MSNTRTLFPVQDCDVCGRATGNLAKHRPACARLYGRVPAPVPLTRDEDALILRAGTHAVHANLLPPESLLQGGVRDLDIARLVHYVERGGLVWPNARTWKADGMPAMRRPSLTLVVNEALRLGIVKPITVRTGPGVYRTLLAAASTHARSAYVSWLPACGRQDLHALRYRLLDRDHLMYVDCQACLDMPRERLA